MASKQPFKLINIQNKLKIWSIRVQKVIKHRILSKRRNALLIGANPHEQFREKLKARMTKTWDIYEVNSDVSLIKDQYEIVKKEQSTRQYDAIIVLPQSNIQGLYDFQSQDFATNLKSFKNLYLQNIFAYRMAHKYLTASGVVILSASQNDFMKAQPDSNNLPRFGAMKNVLQTQTSYLGVTIGDRDYTDLNSWSVIGLSEELVNDEDGDNKNFIVQMYNEWADGKQLPMPGSFAMFKMNEKGMKRPYVQYL